MDRYNFSLDERTVELLRELSKVKFGDVNMSAAIRWLVREWKDGTKKRRK